MLLLLLCGPEAQALTPSLWSEAAISVYGLGAKVTVNPGLEQALWNKEGDLLFDDTWLGLSLRLEGTPAFARAGPELRFSPAAVLEVNAHALGTSYFGNFTALVGFDHPQADYGPEAQQVAIAEGRRSAGRATDLGFDVTVNAQVGPIVLTATGAWSRWTFLPPAENTQDWFYEPEYNVMMASEGETVVSLDAALLYEAYTDPAKDAVIYVGSYNTYRISQEAQDRILRTGLAFVWQLDAHWTWYLLSQATLEDRVNKVLPPFTGTLMEWEL